MSVLGIKATDIANLNEREYKQLMATIRLGRDLVNQEKLNEFAVGDKVSFEDKQGNKLSGEILKILPKNIKLKVGMTNWKVHPSFLTLES